jgi:PKD repeat protein
MTKMKSQSKGLLIILSLSIAFISCSKKDDTPSPTASFNYTAVASNTHAPATLSFMNTSSNAADYSWNFGDGSATSTSREPSHKYTSAGTYQVTLTASVAGKSSTKTQTITIQPAYTSVKVTGITIASTTQTSSFTGYFNITLNGASVYATTTFNVSAVPASFTLGTPYTCTSLSSIYGIELWKKNSLTSDQRLALSPFRPLDYAQGINDLNSYPVNITGIDGLSYTVQWQ